MVTFSVSHNVVINSDIVFLKRVSNECEVVRSQQDWWSGIKVGNDFLRFSYPDVTEEDFIILLWLLNLITF